MYVYLFLCWWGLGKSIARKANKIWFRMDENRSECTSGFFKLDFLLFFLETKFAFLPILKIHRRFWATNKSNLNSTGLYCLFCPLLNNVYTEFVVCWIGSWPRVDIHSRIFTALPFESSQIFLEEICLNSTLNKKLMIKSKRRCMIKKQ